MKKYPNLTAACGGAINPDTLETFRKAIPEYERLMADLRLLLSPVEKRLPTTGSGVKPLRPAARLTP